MPPLSHKYTAMKLYANLIQYTFTDDCPMKILCFKIPAGNPDRKCVVKLHVFGSTK